MKYTIELTDNQKKQMDLLIEMAHKHIGFNPKLEPMEDLLKEYTKQAYEKGYEDGYNQALEDLSNAIKVYFPLNSKERLDYFGTNIQAERYAIENPKDLIAMAKAYEEKKKAEEIKVGDEVKCVYDNLYGVVTKVNHDTGKIRILFYDGSASMNECFPEDYEKTNRHFNEVEQLLDKLRGEEE